MKKGINSYLVDMSDVWDLFSKCSPIVPKPSLAVEKTHDHIFSTHVAVSPGRDMVFCKFCVTEEKEKIKSLLKSFPKDFSASSGKKLVQFAEYVEGGEICAEMLLALGLVSELVSPVLGISLEKDDPRFFVKI